MGAGRRQRWQISFRSRIALLTGRIHVPELGELIMDDADAKGQVWIGGQKKEDGKDMDV